MKRHWTDRLPSEIWGRLCDCRSRKSDIETLVNCKWADMVEKGKAERGFTKEDALDSILELLDCNGQFFALTDDEYNELKQ